MQITDHPVVARSPRPRDFRGLRMPREASSLASTMTIYKLLVVTRGIPGRGGQIQPVVDSRGFQVATRFKWAFLGAVEKGMIGEDKSLSSGPLGLAPKKIQNSRIQHLVPLASRRVDARDAGVGWRG